MSGFFFIFFVKLSIGFLIITVIENNVYEHWYYGKKPNESLQVSEGHNGQASGSK